MTATRCAAHRSGVYPRATNTMPPALDVAIGVDGTCVIGLALLGETTAWFTLTHFGTRTRDEEHAAKVLHEAASTLGRWWREHGYPYALGEGGRIDRSSDWRTVMVCPLIRTGGQS